MLFRFCATPGRYGVVALLAAALSACGGGGGGGGGSGGGATTGGGSGVANSLALSTPALPANNASTLNCPTTSSYNVSLPPQPAAGQIVGRISFDRIPFAPLPAYGLDYGNPVEQPARGVVVEAVGSSDGTSCNGAVLGTTLTDGDGWYQFTPASSSTRLCVRARAQLYRSADTSSPATWNFAVADNTSGDSLYTRVEPSAASATERARRDLHAASGLVGAAYAGERAAAPFAVLDTVCKAMNAVLAGRPDAQFGALAYFWSTRNSSDSNGTLAQGKIGGPFFSPSDGAIYLRGDASANTDEFDEMVIAHEFGHFVTHTFSRSDSIGGDHSLLDFVDPRLAFDESWATAFAALALDTPYYRDSQESTSMGHIEFRFDLRNSYMGAGLPKGWYSEASLQRVLFLFGADSSYGGLSLGINGLLQTAAGNYRNTSALTTIFSYASQLQIDQPGLATAIASILDLEAINGSAIQPFADNENNARSPGDLPVYATISTVTGALTVCSSGSSLPSGRINKLSNRRYLRFDVPGSGRYRFTVQPQTSGVAGFELMWHGSVLRRQEAQSGSQANRTAIYSSGTLPAGTYVLSAYHLGNVVEDTPVAAGNQCFNVKVESI